MDPVKYDRDSEEGGEFGDCIRYSSTTGEGIAHDIPQPKNKDGADQSDDQRA